MKAAALALTLLAAPLAAQAYTPPPPSHYVGIGALQQQLEAKEPDTFAGLWIAPNQRDVIVAFTRNAAATLRRYTTDPKFKPLDRPGPTARDLQATQDRLFPELQRLGARPVSAGVNIMEGKVDIEVVGDMTAAHAAIARGDLVVPPYVKISEPKPLAWPEPPPPPRGYASPVKAFPRIGYRYGGVELAILRMGETVLEEGCLKLKGDRRNTTIVWPNEARLDLSHGDVRIFNRMSGVTIRPGERIILGGNSGPLKDDADVIGADPACPGPYTLVTNFRPSAPFEAEMRERSVKERALREHITEAQARRLMETETAREAELRAFAERLKAERPDLFGALQTFGGKGKLLLAGDPPPGLIPADLAPYLEIERVPQPAAYLQAERDALLDQIEAAGIENVSAGAEPDFGRVLLNVGDNILAVSDAARAGRIVIPDDVQVVTNGSKPAGAFSEWNMEAAWRALESAPDFADIRALVAAGDLPFYGEAPKKPSANAATDIARYVVMLGFTAEEIRALRAQGIDPIADWVRQNGAATLENRAVLAEQVVVGEVVSLDPHGRALNDGHRTTVRFKVAETLKGAAKPGETLTVRLVSGFEPDGSYQQENGEPNLLPGLPNALRPGDRYLLFLSHGQYANLARHAGGKPADASWYALRQEMLRIAPDGALARPYSDAPLAATLAEARTRIAPIAARFEAAGVVP